MGALAALPALVAAAAPYISAASMAIGAVSAVTAYSAQKENAQATEASALAARNDQIQQVQARALQERDAASERVFAERVNALEGSSAARNSAAARGVEGDTVDALAREYWSGQGRSEAAITKTANNMTQQLAAEQRGAQATYSSRVASAPKPSLASLGMSIGGAVATGARDYTQAELARERLLRRSS